ncbi:MAG: ABC transporter substrate-binding protein [Nitrosospira sp.]|nr:ABC transporter substrate-binding protein [Nitrosospira sp.]
MKKINLGISILVTAWLLAFPVSAAEIPPDTLIDTTAQEVLAIIRQDKDIRAGNTGKILNLVEAKVLPHFNFTRMTRLSMGKNWNIATPEQQQELVKEFRTLLVRTYSNALAGYRDHQIKVEPTKVKPGDTDVTVKTQVIEEHGQVPVPIDYSMEYSADGWKVYDVTVAGVSLVTNYRGSFNTQIRDGGVAKLLKTLQEKNRGLEARDKENKTATK